MSVRNRRSTLWSIAAVIALVTVAGALAGARLVGVRQAEGTVLGHPGAVVPRLGRPEEGFVTSSSCASCHPAQHASWHRTYHRTMTQVATPETVAGDFDAVSLELFGHVHRLERAADGFYAEMLDPAFETAAWGRRADLSRIRPAPMVRKRITLITGSHHMQVYWVPDREGTLFQFPFAWLHEAERWVPVEDTLLKPPKNHRDLPTWNLTCSLCHTVAPVPGGDLSGELETAVAELGIACEACHGPGKRHAVANHDPLRRYRLHLADGLVDDTVVNPADIPPRASSEICGQCHGINPPKDFRDWLRSGNTYRAGGELAATRDLILPASRPASPRLAAELARDPRFLDYQFWPDGIVRVSGREYTAMVESACFRGGELSCLNCHSMHASDPDDQLTAAGASDEACLSCHRRYRGELEAHTHHPAASAGSRCANCHMPYTTYGLLKAIRSHRIDSPSIAVTADTGRPDACTACHLDRSLAWAQERLAAWYGQEPVPLSPDQEQRSAVLLALLGGDAGARALAAWHLGWEQAQEAAGTGWQAPFLARTLDDPYAAVRYIAGRSLRRQPGFSDFAYDYVAAPARRAGARTAALARWRQTAGTGAVPPARRGAVLLAAGGGLDEPAIAALAAQRDDRPVALEE